MAAFGPRRAGDRRADWTYRYRRRQKLQWKSWAVVATQDIPELDASTQRPVRRSRLYRPRLGGWHLVCRDEFSGKFRSAKLMAYYPCQRRYLSRHHPGDYR